MYKLILAVFISILTATLSLAVDDTYWKVFNFSKTTLDTVISIFGPPSIIKTEEHYSDWIKNQATGCGQLQTYAMSYSITAGDLNILKGPLGKASEVFVVIDNGKVCEVVWSYNNNQLEPAFRHWMNHKELTRAEGKKPVVGMMGICKPKKGTIVIADCYTGGEGAICRGPILVRYAEDTEK